MAFRFILMAVAVTCSAAQAQIVATNAALVVTRVALEEPAPTAVDSSVTAVGISASGENAAVGFSDGTIAIYSITAPGGVRPLLVRTATVTIPDGRSAWVGTDRAKWVAVFGRNVTGLGFTPSGSLIATTGAGQVLSIAANGVTQTTTVAPHPIAAVSTDGLGGRLLLGSDRGRIAEVGPTAPHAELRVFRVEEAGDAEVHDLRFVHGDAYVFAALEDYRLSDDIEGGGSGKKRNAGPTLWDSRTGTRVQRIPVLQGSVRAVALRLSDRLSLTSEDGSYATIDLNESPMRTSAPIVATRVTSSCPVEVKGTEYLFTVSGPIWTVVHPESGAVVMKTTDGGLTTSYQAVAAFTSGGRVLVVAKSGRCSIVQVNAYVGGPTSIPKRQVLGAAAGKSIVLTHELPTSTAELEEVTASADGAIVVARDREGSVVLWTKDGSAFTGATLPLEVGEIPRTRQSLSLSKWGLLAVCDDGSILHAAMPPSNACEKREYFSGRRRVHVVSAFRYSETSALLGLDDGSVVKADPTSHMVSETIVAAGSNVGIEKPLYVGFHGDGTRRRVLAVPSVAGPDSSKLKVIALPDLKTIYEIPLFVRAARVAIGASGKAWISDSSERVGVHCFDLFGAPTRIGYIHERSDWGLGYTDSEILVGMTKLLFLVTNVAETPPATTAITSGIGPMRSLAQAPVDHAVFVALASGSVIRVAVQ